MQDVLRVTRDGPVTAVVLNRPEKLNALNGELAERLIAAVETASTDGTRLLVFSAAGKGFSGGFDFSGIETQSDGDLALRLIRVEMLLQAVCHAPMNTLALVHGACYGAAADLVCVCHERVCTPDARFRMPGLGFGVVLGTRRLARTVGAGAARDILGKSRVIDAKEALATGFVTRICGQDEWPAIVGEAAQAAQTLDHGAQRAMLDKMVTDTRDADLAALARSVSTPGLKSRIQDYLEKVKRR